MLEGNPIALFEKGTTLNHALSYLKECGCVEIMRIMEDTFGTTRVEFKSKLESQMDVQPQNAKPAPETQS